MRVSRSLGSLGAATLMLNACGGGCDDCVVNSSGRSINANINGLVGSRLTLSNNGVTATIAPGASGQVSGVFSGLAAGAAYSVTVAAQPISPSQTCVVANGSGTMNTATVAISISCTTTPARFLISENPIGAPQYCLTPAAINPDTGVLTAVSAPPLCGTQPSGSGGFLSPPLGYMAVDVQGKFLYLDIANGKASEFRTYSIDRDSGAVSLVGWQNEIASGMVATHPAGVFEFDLSSGFGAGGDVGASRIDPQSGALTFVSDVSFDDEPYGMTVDPLGRFLYVGTSKGVGGASLTPLTFDANSGVLARNAAAVAVGGGWVAADPHGKYLYSGEFLYVGDPSPNGTISAFSVAPGNGALSPISGATVTSADSGYDAAIEPSGHYLYTLNYGGGSVSAYAIDGKTGRLAAIDGSPFPTGAHPLYVLIEPQGRFLYVSDDSGISAFQIDSANGALTPITGSPFPFSFGGQILFSY